MARYIAIETDEGWQVRDTEDGKTLLGSYPKEAAHTTARRLNADINLSPNEMRCMRLLGAMRQSTYSTIGYTFRDNLNPGAYECGKRVAKKLESFGLVSLLDIGEAVITQWGLQWLGLAGD